jgi:Na+/phosphate symporter
MLLAVLAILIGIIGFLFTSQATLGVAIIGFGCLVAIVGRIQQASAQHKELLARSAKAAPSTDAAA